VGQRLGGMTDEMGKALIAGVPAGLVRVQVQSLGYVQAEDSVVVRDGGVDTLRFRLAESPTANPPSSVAGGAVSEPADSIRGPGRLTVRLSPRSGGEVTVSISQNGVLIRKGHLWWNHEEHGTELEFSELPLGKCEVEAKAVRRERPQYMEFRYWLGAARKTVVITQPNGGRSQRTSLQLKWVYGGIGHIYV